MIQQQHRLLPQQLNSTEWRCALLSYMTINSHSLSLKHNDVLSSSVAVRPSQLIGIFN